MAKKTTTTKKSGNTYISGGRGWFKKNSEKVDKAMRWFFQQRFIAKPFFAFTLGWLRTRSSDQFTSNEDPTLMFRQSRKRNTFGIVNKESRPQNSRKYHLTRFLRRLRPATRDYTSSTPLNEKICISQLYFVKILEISLLFSVKLSWKCSYWQTEHWQNKTLAALNNAAVSSPKFLIPNV